MRGFEGRAPRVWRAAFVVIGAALAIYATLSWFGSRRDARIRLAADAARAAVTLARAADAMTWAPAELLAAEHGLTQGLTAQRVEETRWWPLPDEALVAGIYSTATEHASMAARLSGQRRTSAAAMTRALVAGAKAAVASSDDLAARIHIGISRRAVLARAHTVLTEAEVYERHGDFSTATVRARLAAALAAQVRSHAAEVAARYADDETLARWHRWRDETIAWSRREGRAALIVAKEAHTLTLFVKGVPVRTYKVDLGFNWISDKSHAGDGATPEGRYRISARKANGQSVYYKALLLDYPNATDRTEFSRAKRAGEVPASATIGGLIEIHGEGGRGRDWTKGCVAITNAEMDDLFSRVAVGTPVTIVGSDNYGAIAELGGEPRGRVPEPRH